MILGIDVSKDKVDVALFDRKQGMGTGQFANTKAGFKKLNKWLNNKGAGQVWICLEATGRYGEELAEYFFEAGQSQDRPDQIGEADISDHWISAVRDK